jgi:UPF0176 protein
MPEPFAARGDVVVAALYRFTRFPDPAGVRRALQNACAAAGTRGTLLVAGEGLNGTIAGPCEAVRAVLGRIRELPGCADLEPRLSSTDSMPFHRMKVRLKREIVTMGVAGVDPTTDVGDYVEPQDWNAVIRDPRVVVIDTRNDYEVGIGTFEGAVNPRTASFRDFPAWFAANWRDAEDTSFALFCTGGIRCEKATSLLKGAGYRNVLHLRGGILGYLETVPARDSLWRGECFVFDQRAAVTHGLAPGSYGLCHGCRRPVGAGERASAHFVEGVSCPNCHDRVPEWRKARHAERQMKHAEQLGMQHLGADFGRPDQLQAPPGAVAPAGLGCRRSS